MARMDLPVLDKFCFKYPLRSGCFYMAVVNSFLSGTLGVILMVFAINQKAPGETSQRRDDADAGAPIFFMIVLLLFVLLLIKSLVDLMLAVAISRDKCGFIKRYCILWVVFMVLLIIGFLKSLFQMDAEQVIAEILFLAENLYFITLIRSHLISMNEDGVL